MSAIRCEECPYFDGMYSCHSPDVVGARHLGGSKRPIWCPRRRDASSRCRVCGERLVRWAEKGDALIEMYCPRCAP